MSLNKVMLIGRLGQDAELKTTPNGASYLVFSLATSETWKDKATGEKKEKTEWQRCKLWGDRAKSLAQYMVKGKEFFVEGSLETTSFEKDGVKKFVTDVKVSDVRFVGSKDSNGPSVAKTSTATAPQLAATGTDDGYPDTWDGPGLG